MPNDIPDWTGKQNVQLVSSSGQLEGDVSGAALSSDIGTETITATNGPFAFSDGVMASFKPAVAGVLPARVGALGALTQVASTPITPPFGQATTAGNLLVVCVSATGATEPTTVAAGWAKVISFAGSGPWVAIWAKPNCGAAEAAPQFTAVGGPMWAQAAEFAGVAVAAPTDRTASGVVSGTTVQVAMPGVDASFGDLIVLATRWATNGNLATATFTETFNNGAAPVHMGDSGAVAAARHVSFAYGIVPLGVTALPLGVAPWDYDADGASSPGVGVQASVVLAASAGKAYRCVLISADLAQTTAAASIPNLQLLDGVTVRHNAFMATTAVIGAYVSKNLPGVAYKGALGASMTLKFVAASVGCDQSVNIGAYLR